MTPKLQENTERTSDSSEFQDTQEEEHPESETKVVQVKKSVRFSQTAKVRQVPKWTKAQAEDVWFTNDDFNVMKKSFAPTVQLMTQGIAPEEDTDDHCLRGLEYRTRDGARKRMKNKFKGMAAVLHEQDRQSFEDKHDPELLAEVYRQVTNPCLFEALALGHKDERDIQSYISTDNEPFYDVLQEQQQQCCASPGKGFQTSVAAGGIERGFRGSLKRFWSGSGRLIRRNPAGVAA